MESFLRPLESGLGIRLESFAPLIQGQLTFALVQDGWLAKDSSSPGFLLLLDAGNKSADLKKNLAQLRKYWSAAGKLARTEKIRDVEFTVVALQSNAIPRSVSLLFPEPADTNAPAAPPPGHELLVGQTGSLLILASTIKSADTVLSRLATNPPAPPETGVALSPDQLEIFRDSFCYGWINARALLDFFNRMPAPENAPDVPANPMDINPAKLIAGLGLSDQNTVVFGARNSGEGALLRCYVAAAQTNRHGLLGILPGEPKDSTPPPFVPADAIKFWRWRFNGPATWAKLENIVEDLSPQSLRGLNFVIDSAAAKAKNDDATCDLRKQLFGNLGDDFISYQRSVQTGVASNAVSATAWIHLLSSPDADGLAVALKKLFVIFPAGDAVAEREAFGHKLYSLPLPSLALGPDSPPPSEPAIPRTLHFGASGGRVALSTDAAMVEDYMKTNAPPPKALRDTPRLLDAAQHVLGPGAAMFGCHFNGSNFVAYGWSGDTNGLSFKIFAPALRK